MKFDIIVIITILFFIFIFISQFRISEGMSTLKKNKQSVNPSIKSVNPSTKSVNPSTKDVNPSTKDVISKSSVKLTNELNQCKANLAASEKSESSLLSQLSRAGLTIQGINTNVDNTSKTISSLLNTNKK